MKAMLLHAPGQALKPADLPTPVPVAGQVLIKVRACGVCRTDLHVKDGELPRPKLPLVLGHEIIGIVEKAGKGARFSAGDRVGVPWLGYSCRACAYCLSGRENLCDAARFTGYDIDGGYAEYALADSRYCFPIPRSYSDAEAAPLMCAGLIGYRALSMAPGKRLGIYGFGVAAHIIAQVARHQGRSVYAFTRAEDAESQEFAKSLGAVWAGGSLERPPEELDSAILFAPVGALVPAALRSVAKGGRVVCAGIHMSDIPSFPYSILWEERAIQSVANLTPRDAEEFLNLAPQVPVRTTVRTFPLGQANEALDLLRQGRIQGAAVLTP